MPVRLSRTVCLHLCLLAFACSGLAQATSTPLMAVAHEDNGFHYRESRQVVIYQGGHFLALEGNWRGGDALRELAATHRNLAGGNFILFQDAGGPVRQLIVHAAVSEVQASYAPLTALAAQQHALALQQQPLAAQQHALATEMRAAATPAQMGTIGSEQGRIGRLQGQIGHEQGLLGQQQGQIARVYYTQLQNLIDACLRRDSCPAVEPSSTASR